MEQKKKKVFIQSDYTLAKTGFGKNNKAIFEYLYKTGKYDLVNFAIGSVDASGELDRTPWKTIPSIQISQLDEIKRQNDPKNWENIERMAGYGAFALDNAVMEEKPDVFIGIQDIWGIDFSVDKGWFKKIKCALWTTLDSRPILPKAVEIAGKVKHFWSWADFATKDLQAMGHKHVETVRGAIDTKFFFALPMEVRLKLRMKYKIASDQFIIGFVFRNQLRKSVPNLLQGFNLFKKEHPEAKAKLLLHTCWSEGWDIPKLMEEHKISKEDVLTTYICRHCRQYDIRSFTGQELDCPHCRAKKQLVTTHPTIGVEEEHLNEIYNLMDVYCHPFTSGGQEIPIQEAKLAELITLVTNYSCGEDACVPDAASLPLDWSEYREPGTQFVKASTSPTSICKQLTKVFKMKPADRKVMGKKGRQWIIDNFSIEKIGKFLEDFIDSAPVTDYDFKRTDVARDPTFNVPVIEDNGEWVLTLYKNILKMEEVDKNNDGYKHWMKKLSDGMSRQEIEQFFRKVAMEENQKINAKQTSFEDLLDKNDKGRVLVVQPESAGDILLVTALFKSIKERYPDWALYVATKKEYYDLIQGNPYVSHWIEYNPMMDNLVWLEGSSTHKGYFDIAYLPYIQTQKYRTYLHNGIDTMDFKLTN